MISLIHRVWDTSPASLTYAIRRRLKCIGAGESWHKIAAGPACRTKPILPKPLPGWEQDIIAGTYDEFLYEAVADGHGEPEFVKSTDVSSQSSGSHLASATRAELAKVYARFERRFVPAVTMDTPVEKQSETPPDIIKIDVESADHLALQGLRRLLAEPKLLLLIEAHHLCVMLLLTRLLTVLGYNLVVLDQHHASAPRCFVLGSAA